MTPDQSSTSAMVYRAAFHFQRLHDHPRNIRLQTPASRGMHVARTLPWLWQENPCCGQDMRRLSETTRPTKTTRVGSRQRKRVVCSQRSILSEARDEAEPRSTQPVSLRFRRPRLYALSVAAVRSESAWYANRLRRRETERDRMYEVLEKTSTEGWYCAILHPNGTVS